MIAEDQAQEFEAHKQEVYRLFKEAITTDIWSNFEDIAKIIFVAVDDNLTIYVEGEIMHADWFTQDLREQLVMALMPIKRMSSDEVYGSWISAEMIVDHEHDKGLFFFNYDEFLPGRMEKYTATNYQRELEFFPRKDAGVPEWMKKKLED